MEEKFVSKSAEETFMYAKKMATCLRGGEVIALYGDLGAGKTVFAKGLAEGLGVKGAVNSPTFVVMKTYGLSGKQGLRNFCHIDAYRLRSSHELSAIGAGDYIGASDSVVLIEWADRIEELLAGNVIRVRVSAQNETERLMHCY